MRGLLWSLRSHCPSLLHRISLCTELAYEVMWQGYVHYSIFPVSVCVDKHKQCLHKHVLAEVRSERETVVNMYTMYKCGIMYYVFIVDAQPGRVHNYMYIPEWVN